MTGLVVLWLISVFISCKSTIEKPADVLAAEALLPPTIDYNLHVKPILSDRCFACHGPDQAKQEAGLRLDTPDGAYTALVKSGHRAIVPGDLASSEMVYRITTTDPDEIMPTPNSNLVLSAEEKAILIRWVEQGATYQKHWSLIVPTLPELPTVTDNKWIKNDIDRFVLAKLESKKQSPNPEADRNTLLRRVSLDLTGLPPTPAEVDAFMADSSPNAYEKVVNRLLNSPHYGERQAVEWLDVARYADSHGYQSDGLRIMWPYRDWVIRAFNKNLSFDRFITWQLAGDLLPNPTKSQLIATAFNRNHQQTQEGGIIPEEYMQAYIADRTDTFGKAMLGLTVECARCHDHKYDPISHKDYYSLSAFFAQNNDNGRIPSNGEPSPHITLPSPEAEARLTLIRKKIQSIDQSLSRDRKNDAKTRFAGWMAQAQRDPTKVSWPARQDLMVDVPFDKYTDRPVQASKKDKKSTPAKFQRIFANVANDTLPLETDGDLDYPIPFVKSPVGKGVKMVGESFLQLKNVYAKDNREDDGRPAWFERNEPFTVALWVNAESPKREVKLFNRSLGPFNGFRGYECVQLDDGRLSFRLIYVWPDNAIELETLEKLPVGRWTHITMAYDGTSRAAGLQIYLNGKPARVRVMTDHLTQGIIFGKNRTNFYGSSPNLGIGQLHDQNYRGYSVDELRVYSRTLTPLEVRSLVTQRDEVQATLRALQTTPEPSEGPKQSALFAYFLTNVDQPTQKLRRARQHLLGQETRLMNEQTVDLMVMRERKYPRPTHILNRGAYDDPGEAVTPAVLHSMEPMKADMPRNRLGLAQWLLTADNPLFTRVIVNRMWQQYFGQGLAKNSDDFGNQGALPSHPELLDYLAVRFREGKYRPSPSTLAGPWNFKGMHKMIVMSATYRQSSIVPEEKRETDPDNVFLSRGPSYRMSAEQVRDNALTASGLLNRHIGGPSVHPYQPDGIWEALATFSYDKYIQQHGDSLYRRSLYTIWKRTAPAPMMLNFDASERHICVVKRQKTSTPLQALVTLNDPQFVEAARVLAQRQGFGTEREGADWKKYFKAIISRPPRPQELQLMEQLYAEELADFRRNPKRAQELLSVGEYPVDVTQNAAQLAARTVVVSTIMNFDEAIIKR